MTNSEIILTLIKYIIPTIFIFGAAYYFTNKWYDIQSQKMKVDAILDKGKTSSPLSTQSANAKLFFPMQIDAVQRMVLFLERITPTSMVLRLHNPGLPAKAFQQKLIEAVRDEFEHNLAQQVYVSSEAWEHVKMGKEEVVKIINMAATKMEPTALAGELGQAIFEITAQMKQQPTELPIEVLKAELRSKL